MKDYRSLKVWEKAHQLACRVYTATRSFPRDEIYGLTSQMRRAGVSIPANIAEGCGRGSDPELARFLAIAAGSVSELLYLVLLARDLGLIEEPQHRELEEHVAEVKRMISRLTQTLRSSDGAKSCKL